VRRNMSEFISTRALLHVRYIPLIISSIKNWPSFLLNYMGLRDSEEIYSFRSGVKIKTREGIDAATIMVVFLKKDYGVIPDNSIVVDIGANIGVFAIYAASTARNTTVYAFEPAKDSFDCLLRNVKLNGVERVVHPFNLGVSAKKEKRKLFLASLSPFHSLYSRSINQEFISINCISLNDILEQNKIDRVDVLKVDCEGAEFEILRGLSDGNFRRIKEIRMEYHNQHDRRYSVSELETFLEQKGFKRVFFREFLDQAGNIWFRQQFV